MPERTLLRMGAVSAIVGAVLAIVGNVIAPRTTPGDLEAALQSAAESAISMGSHLVLMIAGLFVLGGMVALYRSITEGTGAALARLGFTAALVGGAVLIVGMVIHGVAFTGVAEAWANAPAAEKAIALQAGLAVWHIDFAVHNLWIFVFLGVSPLLYGLAIAVSDVYPKWLGWVAVVLGTVAALLGLVQASQGTLVPANVVLFAVVSLLITVWLLVMGVFMWRRAGAAA